MMTHRELIIVLRKFHLYETQFSLFLKMLPHHKKRLYDSLLNANETLMKMSQRYTRSLGANHLNSNYVKFDYFFI
jgi:hypothetical protein